MTPPHQQMPALELFTAQQFLHLIMSQVGQYRNCSNENLQVIRIIIKLLKLFLSYDNLALILCNSVVLINNFMVQNNLGTKKESQVEFRSGVISASSTVWPISQGRIIKIHRSAH